MAADLKTSVLRVLVLVVVCFSNAHSKGKTSFMHDHFVTPVQEMILHHNCTYSPTRRTLVSGPWKTAAAALLVLLKYSL